MEIDKSNMRQIIIDSAKQLKEGLDLAKNVKIGGNFKNVIICGIGGSALPADLLKSVTDSKIPIYVHRDYNLPKFTTKESLIIFISYSGNTEEVISSIEDSLSNKLSSIGISSGGKLEKICQENEIPFVKIPSGIQPRLAIGYIFSALFQTLHNAGIINDISSKILETSDKLESLNNEFEDEGKKIAKNIADKIPIIYSSDNFRDVAKIWKIKFNENSKVPSFYNCFPELNHNEMVGFSNSVKNNNFYFIILKDTNDHERNKIRMDLFSSLIDKRGAKTYFVEIKEGSTIFKVFSTLLLGDWTSYYLALEQKIDPTPVEIVEEFKKLLQK